LENVSAAIVILWAIEHADSLVGRLLNSKLLAHIGVISYSLYLWQQLFLTPLNATFSGHFPINLVCAVLAAECSYFLLEQPALALGRRVMGKTIPVRAKQAPAPAAKP